MMSVVGAGGALGGDGGFLGGDGGKGGVGGEEGGGGAEAAFVDWFVCDALVDWLVCDALVDWFVCDADWFVCDAARAHVAASMTVRRLGAIFFSQRRIVNGNGDLGVLILRKEKKGKERNGKFWKKTRAAYRLPAWSPTAVLPILEAA